MLSFHRRWTPQRGFTLIELLVAISILATVAVLSWRALDGLVRSRAALTAQLENSRTIQMAFAQLESDCAYVVKDDPTRDGDSFFFEDGRVVMIRNVYEENQATRRQIVAYRVLDGVLTRRASNPTRDAQLVQTNWKDALSNADNFPPIALQSGVTSLVLRTWSNDQRQWVGTGATQVTGGAPGLRRVVRGPGARNGLEVSLQLDGQPAPILKLLFLGIS